MNIETEISRLLALAAPLRCIPEDDPAHIPLAGIVDEINRLRAMQATGITRLVPAGDAPLAGVVNTTLPPSFAFDDGQPLMCAGPGVLAPTALAARANKRLKATQESADA